MRKPAIRAFPGVSRPPEGLFDLPLSWPTVETTGWPTLLAATRVEEPEMAKKKPLTGSVTVTFKVKQTDGPTPETLDSLQEWIESEWDGTEAYIADPDLEEETVVELVVEKIEVIGD